MIATDLKTGTIYKENETPFLVLKYFHIKSSRGSANVRVKVRNLLNNSVLEKSYIAGAKVLPADVYRKNVQFLYESGGEYFFMDPETFEQINISAEVLGDQEAFLKAGEKLQVLYFESDPVSVELPITLTFEITYTEPGFKGNTVSNVYKDATLDNGTVVKVPSFLKIGDVIKVDTRTGEYVSKA